MADATRSLLTPRSWTRAWPILAAAVLAIQAGALFMVKPGAGLQAYSDVVNSLLAAGLAASNAIASRQAIRLFWAFLALGCGVWALNAWSWVYLVGIKHNDHPDFLLSGAPLYLHIIFFIAAVASRPHLKLSQDKPYRTTLNLLLLLFFWAFAYSLVIFPISYMQYDSSHILRVAALYSAENLLLLVVLGVVLIRAQPPWKTIYWHLFGASVLYALGSLTASLTIASGRYTAGWHTFPYTIAAYWFVWVILRGRELAPQLAQNLEVDTINPRYASTLAILAVVAIPIVGLWELLRADQPYATRVIRLLIVFLALLLLAVTALVTEYFTKRELSSDVEITQDRLRMAMTAGKSMGWELDVKTGRDFWFGDLRTTFGIESDTFAGQVHDFYRYLHPDDRRRVSEAVNDSRANHRPYAAEFRVIRQDGTIRWLSANGKFFYAKTGEAVRMLGMAVDITEHKQAEEALRKSEEKFSKAFREAPMALTLTSARDHRYLDVNETFGRLTGWRRDEVIGRTPFDIGIWEQPSQRVEFAKQLVERGSIRDLEVRYRCKDGAQRIGLGSAELIDVENEPCALSVIADITDRKQIEAKFRASERRLAGIVESAMDAIIAVNDEQRIVLFNNAAEKMFGCAATEAIGTSIDRFMPQRFRSQHNINISSFGQSGTTNRTMGALGTLWARRTSGEEFPIEASISQLDADGKKLFTVIIRDVTERLKMEEAQRQSEERLHLAVQAGKMYAYEWNAATDRIIRSPEYVDILGANQPSETSRHDLLRQVHPDDRERLTSVLDVVTPQNPTSQITYRLLRPDGDVIWLEKRTRAFFDPQGGLLRTVGVVADITARKHAEQALRLSEERHRHLIDSSHDWVWEVDADAVYTHAGPQCRGTLGYEPEEIVGRTPFDLMPPEEAHRVAAVFHAIAAERKPFRGLENANLHKDGHLVVLETNGVPVIDENGGFHGYRGMNRDITERKRVEHALRESEQRFRQVANAAPVMIWMSDPENLCTYVNQPWLAFTGRPLEDQLGDGWAKGIHPEDREQCLRTVGEAAARREPCKMHYRYRQNDGEYRWLFDTCVPRFNPDGSFAGYIGSCSDVTDQKLAEEALASIGRRLIEAHEEERTYIARELHDDINQRVALLAVELEQWSRDLPASAHQHIHSTRQRLSDIAKDVQALSHRLHSSKLEYLGIVAAANSFCRELSEQQEVQVVFIHSDVPHTLPAEVSLCLFRVLQEALQNAVKHSGARHIKVELRGSPDEIQLTVSDPGTGFDSRAAMTGPGLGLISMRERLRLIDGEFSVNSEPDRGTTIYARVPLKKEEYRVSVAG